jgi:hypothetical protein
MCWPEEVFLYTDSSKSDLLYTDETSIAAHDVINQCVVSSIFWDRLMQFHSEETSKLVEVFNFNVASN